MADFYGPKVYKDNGGDRLNIVAGGSLSIRGGQMSGFPPTTDYYVDGTLGNSANDGLSWGADNALATISQAVTKVEALGATTVSRGRHRIFVAPGGYTEDIVLPLNTVAPFGQLIAWNPTRRSAGSTWLISSTTTLPAITVRARGWLIDGFEIDANSGSGGGCIKMDGTASNAESKFLNVRNCLFIGSTQAGAYGLLTDAPHPLTVIEDCWFLGFAGKCIDATDFPLQWEIARCLFENSASYIAPSSSKGFQQAYIHDNTFNHISGDYTATTKIDMRGGAQNHIGPNNFLGGAYDNSPGGYYASGTDYWRGNHSEDSENGSAQANPAA